MARDEIREALAVQRAIWTNLLRECGADEEEIDKCIQWLEEVVLNGILIGWFIQGRISMRWNALEGEPDFDAL